MAKESQTHHLSIDRKYRPNLAFNPSKGLKELGKEEQQILRQFRDQWGQLPADRQERLRRRAERRQRMTPEERKEAKERFKRWQELTPEQREMIRKRHQELLNLPRKNFQKGKGRKVNLKNSHRTCQRIRVLRVT